MDAIKRCLFALAVSTITLAGTAHAVYLNPLGPGQALLFPYYTVRSSGGNAFNTYISVANSSAYRANPVVAKVRFREGRNSRLVAEFDVYLNAGDMWTGAVVPDGQGARLVSRDRSCTNPAIPAEGLLFSTAAFSSGDDKAGTGVERTQEGHFEIIEMAALPETLAVSLNPANPQFNCATVQGANPSLGGLTPPMGVLTGTATLINVASGLDASYVPDVLAGLTSSVFYTPPGQPGADFDSPLVDAISHAVVDNVAYRLVWNRGIDAVNSVLMSEFLENEFVLDPETQSKTDWVVTWPTRRLLVNNTTAQAPFTAPFAPIGATGSVFCEGVSIGLFLDREGRSNLPGVDFPERPPSATRQCWSAGAFSVRTTTQALPAGPSDILGSTNTLGVPAQLLPTSSGAPSGISAGSFTSGHMQMRFDGLGFLATSASSSWVDLRTGATGTGPVSLLGYPTIGFLVRTFQNGALSCGGAVCQGNYASAFPHRRVTRFTRQ